MEHEEDDTDSTSCAVCHRPNRNYYTYMCQKTSLLCCTACRTFFVESVQQKHFKNFQCREQKNCDLAQKRGKLLCKFCRFQTCLKVGMTEESIKPTRKFKVSNNQRSPQSRAIKTLSDKCGRKIKKSKIFGKDFKKLRR